MRESRKKEGRGGLRTRHLPSGDTEVSLMWADVVDVMMSSGQDHVVVL